MLLDLLELKLLSLTTFRACSCKSFFLMLLLDLPLARLTDNCLANGALLEIQRDLLAFCTTNEGLESVQLQLVGGVWVEVDLSPADDLVIELAFCNIQMLPSCCAQFAILLQVLRLIHSGVVLIL